ncbi:MULTISPECIES: hypothetical protein [Flavobacteriaceae]|uniref:hypothetical protein n=1 Tax=Flavobacteriaceae TaxID=49546 RepID=UPI001491F39C|nr:MULTISPECIES: hypothetical protein [Allomuricauda]MDC6366966.1 hypothetical protein [Muricauda sp. AC10]
MKTLRLIVIPAFLSILIFGCKAEPLEGDEDAPIIEILSPEDNASFYASNSASSPNSIQIRAKATDNNAVVFGILTIADENGDLVDADFDTNLSENNNVMELTGNFSTDTPGTYTLKFLFRDANDNNASVTRTVECLAGGGTDEQAEEEEEEPENPTNPITFQFFASDKKNETVLRIDIYEDGHSANLITNQVIDAKGISLYPNQEELLFGSTQEGLNVEIFSSGMDGKNLNSTVVSNANYLFSTLAKDYNREEIYYFLEGADLTKVPRHALYRMDADGSNQTMVAQIDNATRENAIKKILMYDNNGSPILIMHDRTALYVYNPEGEVAWEDSKVYSQDGIEIYDIEMGADNKTVYMILKYGNYYNVGTTTIEGADTNTSLVHIPENHPAAADNLPHRMKVDVENQHIYWFTQSEDRQKSILKRASFNDTAVQTLWETSTCLCDGETEEIRIEDYQINTGAIIAPSTN